MKPRQKRWRKRFGSTLPAAVVAALAAAACERPAPPAPEPRMTAPVAGGTVVVAVESDISGVNPLLMPAETFNQDLARTLFLHLFEEQPDYAEHPPTFAPLLAESWTWSDGGKLLDLELRAEVVWSDGTPLTAADVVWTWERQIDPQIAWRYATSKQAIEAVEALGEHRLRVRFSSPSPTRLAELNLGPVLPRHRWAELPPSEWVGNGDWFRERLVVSGPFLLERWQPGQEIVLARNPRYYRPGLPRLDKLVFRIVPVATNRLNQLLGGGVHLVHDVQPTAAPRIAEHPELVLESFWSRQYNFISWNLARPWFAEAAARRALTQAIDRQALVDTLWRGFAAVASSPIPSTVWAHRRGDGPWPYDPEEARRLLAELGWLPGADGVLERRGERFSFELMTNTGNRDRVDAAVMIQQDLRRVGIEARPRTLDINTVSARATAHEFDAVLLGINIDTSLDLGYGFHSASADGGLNLAGYANPEVDRLIERQRAAADAAEVGRLLDRIQEILHRDLPITPLWEPQRLHGVDRRLRGRRPNPLSQLFAVDEWWLAPDGAPVGVPDESSDGAAGERG